MLDHVFTDAIGALREVFEDALLERQAFEERFNSDVLLGDLTWVTSYALPGEGLPARAQADITLEWPTWSQTAYRSWYLTEEFTEPPRIAIEIVFRLQRLSAAPDATAVLAALPLAGPAIGDAPLVRSGPTVEQAWTGDLAESAHAFEVSFEGAYDLGEDALVDGSAIDVYFAALGGWVAATLVALGDLPLEFHPPVDAD